MKNLLILGIRDTTLLNVFLNSYSSSEVGRELQSKEEGISSPRWKCMHCESQGNFISGEREFSSGTYGAIHGKDDACLIWYVEQGD